MKKVKDVTAAIILDGDGKVFIARRAPGENMAGGWEFPGESSKKTRPPKNA